jgi:hypothetical protein
MALVSAVVGCGGRLDVEAVGEGAFLFPEDAVPIVAGLPYVETQLLVQTYPGTDDRALAEACDEVGAAVLERIEPLDLTVLRVRPGELDRTAARLDAAGLIEAAAKNYIFEPARIPDDPYFIQQQHLEQINAPAAWDEAVGDPRIIIAILDTGIDVDHEDLGGKVLAGWNIHDNNADLGDVAGHGTYVAGIAAASSNNTIGVTGVSWESMILPVRVTDEEGRTTTRDLAAGILWAVNHDAKVINVSFGPLWSNRIVKAAAEHAFNRGALVVISAGNSGITVAERGYLQALFVGAVDGSDAIASFSDRGPFVDLVAPGVGVRSTMNGAGYGLGSGTSSSAPIVSGVAALAWSVNPALRPAAVRTAVLASAVDLGPTGKDPTFGQGAVDAHAAVVEAARLIEPADTTPPTVSVDRPFDGAVLSGRFVATVAVSDSPSDGGVADVAFSIDGVPFATDTRAPYRFMVDGASFSPGRHELRFVATDLAGNASSAASVSVTFRRSADTAAEGSSTSISFHSPADGAVVSGVVTIEATVSDEDGLATVEWLIDGEPVWVSAVSGQSSRVSYAWRAQDAFAGRHTVSIVVLDVTGRQARADLELVRE